MGMYTAIITREEDMFVAKCPEIGTVSQGKSVEEALANLKEATELYLEEFPVKGVSHPILATFEVADGLRA
ncbi:type II toxin-antitoxin system HicB family antitoxin [Candidatus Woesearchaeota archaeon]|nr:type II toxin-antitoxin system HicB family antitoxin [Candidatus Woesearchaeota archaeon]